MANLFRLTFTIGLYLELKPGFHYTANGTTTTQKQSDYKDEQSSFTLIALFLLEIGRCRGRNWLNGNQAFRRKMTITVVRVKPGLHISRKDHKHIVTNMYFKLYRYGLVSKSL